jgi:hypothetical protein
MTTEWLTTEQQRAWRAFLLGSTLLMDRLDRDLRENHDLSLPEYEILVRLSESADRALRMSWPTPSRTHAAASPTRSPGLSARGWWSAANVPPMGAGCSLT